MPKLKKQTFTVGNKAGESIKLELDIMVSADGGFYGYVPEYLRPALSAHHIANKQIKPGMICVKAVSLGNLEKIVQDALSAYLTPVVTEEYVIRYNIEAHVSFAEDEDGNVFPNATHPGANWPDSALYGRHSPTDCSPGGYSMIVGARVSLKRTYRFGDSERIEYDRFYSGHTEQARLLNSWNGFILGKSPKEIPYSDEAALFFHNLLTGMATLCRRIQRASFQQEDLLALIAKTVSANNLLPVSSEDFA